MNNIKYFLYRFFYILKCYIGIHSKYSEYILLPNKQFINTCYECKQERSKFIFKLKNNIREGRYTVRHFIGVHFSTYGECVRKHSLLYKLVHMCWLFNHKWDTKTPFCNRCGIIK